jgi:hypothetical protein
MATIPIKLKDAEISKIYYLVKLGKYKSRNQAIRSLIENSLSREPLFLNELNPNFDEIKVQLFQIWDQIPNFTLTLQNGKSWVDQISHDRDR